MVILAVIAAVLTVLAGAAKLWSLRDRSNRFGWRYGARVNTGPWLVPLHCADYRKPPLALPVGAGPTKTEEAP